MKQGTQRNLTAWALVAAWLILILYIASQARRL